MVRFVSAGLLFVLLLVLTVMVAQEEENRELSGIAKSSIVQESGFVIKDPVPEPFVVKPDLSVSNVQWARRHNGDVLLSFDVSNIGTRKSIDSLVSVSFPQKQHSQDVSFRVPSLLVAQSESYTLIIVASSIVGEQEFVVSIDPGQNDDLNPENNRASVFVYTPAVFV